MYVNVSQPVSTANQMGVFSNQAYQNENHLKQNLPNDYYCPNHPMFNCPPPYTVPINYYEIMHQCPPIYQPNLYYEQDISLLYQEIQCLKKQLGEIFNSIRSLDLQVNQLTSTLPLYNHTQEQNPDHKSTVQQSNTISSEQLRQRNLELTRENQSLKTEIAKLKQEVIQTIQSPIEKKSEHSPKEKPRTLSF